MVNPVGGSGTEEGRDGACTPRWLAEVIGEVGLDPCSNSRSHIQAMWKVRSDLGGDGLGGTLRGTFIWAGIVPPRLQVKATSKWRVFVNCPYARGQVIRWVRHYRGTNFIFLLRWAPDTEWYAELWPWCWGAWFPRKCAVNPSGRINFDPPPGVEFSSNPFPHALYLRNEPTGDFLDRLLATGYLVRNERQRGCDSVNVPAGPAPQGGASGSRETAEWIGAWVSAKEEGEAAQERRD